MFEQLGELAAELDLLETELPGIQASGDRRASRDAGRRYTPLAGSPLIDVGDPAGGAGNDIGAIGAGTPNAADGFGIF